MTKQHVEATPYQTLVYVDSETVIEVISDDRGYTVNRFRDGEAWTELYSEEYTTKG